MEIKAQLNGLRISPRKARLVSGALKGMNAMTAKGQLDHFAKRSAKPIAKLLDSAMANAHNNFGLVKENLYIKRIIVDEGVKLKRFRPKGFGSTSPIEKKTSHIRIILDEKVPGMKAQPKAKTQEMPIESKIEKTATTEKEKKPVFTHEKEIKEAKKKEGAGGIKNFSKRFFRRKAI